jgi:hypothetical protein
MAAIGTLRAQRHRRSGALSQMLFLGILIIALAFARPVSAQVTTMRGLDFGLLLPGIPKTILPTDAAAAQWRYRPLLTLLLNVSFTLPTSLSRVGGGGSLPISFCSTCAIYRINSDNPSGGVTFNPETGAHNLSITLLSNIYFWLGAVVSPTVSQPAGSYSGTVTITLAIL